MTPELWKLTGEDHDPPFNGGDYVHNGIVSRIRRFFEHEADLWRQLRNFYGWDWLPWAK